MVEQISPNNVRLLLLFMRFKITYFCHFHRYLDFLQVVHLQLNVVQTSVSSENKKSMFQLYLVESSFSGENEMSMDTLKILVTFQVLQKISHWIKKDKQR